MVCALVCSAIFHYLAEPNYLSKCENFPYFLIGRLCHGPFLLMVPVNPVLPGEGRYQDSSNNLSTESEVLFLCRKTACSHFGRCVLAR